MPIPKPRPDEQQDAFISRCMGDDVMKQEYEQDQRVAVCHTAWRDKEKSMARMTGSSRQMKLDDHAFRATKLELRSGEGLPKGVCGRVSGVALTYNVADDYGTVFVPGCLTKTRSEKVNTGKVKLFADHGPFTDTHVGVVRSLDDRGDSVMMVADLFDTEAGRNMKEYLSAVLASGADTGLSIGFRPHGEEWKADAVTGKNDMMLFYKEIELREVSITPVPAVPGTDILAVRSADLLPRALRTILKALPKRDAQDVFDSVYSAAPPDTVAVPLGDEHASISVENTTNAAVVTESARNMTQATETDRVRAIREALSVA